MVQRLSGETSLKVGARTVRLRLHIGAMMDLEDYFNMGLIPFLSERLPEFRLKDMAVLYLAMTGKDFTDEALHVGAASDLVKAGLKEATIAIAGCLQETLSPTVSTKPTRPMKSGTPTKGKP